MVDLGHFSGTKNPSVPGKIADHLVPAKVPTIGGRKPFKIASGSQALQRTVNCRMTADDDAPVLISIPNVLGALVLKGAAYREDSRDKDRHLDDAVVLCATISSPLDAAIQMNGTDKSRLLTLHKEARGPGAPVLTAPGPSRSDAGDGFAPNPGSHPQPPSGEPAQARLALPHLSRRCQAGPAAASSTTNTDPSVARQRSARTSVDQRRRPGASLAGATE